MSTRSIATTGLRHRSHLSLSWRFLLFAIGVMLLNGLLLSSRTDHTIETAFLHQADQKIHLLLDQIKRNVEQGRLTLNDSTLAQEVSYLNQHSRFSDQLNVLALYAFNDQGEVIAHSAGNRAPKDMSADSPYYRVVIEGLTSLGEAHEVNPMTGKLKGDYLLPMMLPDGTRAGIEAEIDITGLEAAISSFDAPFEQSMWISIILSSLLLLLALGGLIYKRLTKPVEHLHQTVLALSAGNLESRVKHGSSDEVGQLGAGINHLADSIQSLLREQEETYLATLSSLAKALQAKDPYTAAHSGRVSRYAVRLGQQIGLDDVQLELLKKGALMHDLGKIGIHDTILNKPTALTDEEYREMRKHPVMTAAIMKPLKHFRAFAEIAAWHHERWDGKGYPDGLAGDKIPLLARIVAIADTWDAMTGDRVYRRGMPRARALDILESEQDQGQFDPELIRAFINMIKAELAAAPTDAEADACRVSLTE